MERTKETLEARVRETPLVDRLKECQQRIGNMCAELRGPKMSIPVEYYDDDFYICTTLADAQATVEALQTKYDDLLGKYRQLVDFYDKHNGTPCEQIRHRQQVEALQWEVANLKACQCDGCAETLEENDVYCEKCWTRQQTALDAERAEIAKVRATCDMLGKERNEADEAKYHAELKLSQLQALVREVANAGVAFEDGRIPYKEVQIDRDWFDRARATLDATTPAPDTSIIGKCEPPSQWDPNAQVRGDIS